MREGEIRRALRLDLETRYPDRACARIVEELGVWSGSARIDLAVIGRDLYGIEIKSAQDSLKRLDRQVDLYGRVFDRIDLVVDPRHVLLARGRIPSWWGLVAIRPCVDGAILERLQESTLNPSPQADLVSGLLWRDEVLAVLRRHGLARGWSGRNKPDLDRYAASSLSRADLTLAVCECLRQRQDWRGASA